MNRLTALVFLICGLLCHAHAQTINDVCERAVPAQWQALQGSLSVSDMHFKIGEQSIKWQWTNGAKSKIIVTDSAFGSVASNPRSAFVIWIYNPAPVNGRLLFKFEANGKTSCSFEFGLNYKGWRTAWVMYHRDMKGRPTGEMGRLVIEAPRNQKKGTLFFDRPIFNATLNPRSPMRDLQVPFVNPGAEKAANAHWTSLYKFSRIHSYLKLQKCVSASDAADIKKITDRFIIQEQGAKKRGQNAIGAIEKEYAYWNIRRFGQHHTLISGRPIYCMNDVELESSNPSAAFIEDNRSSGIKRYTQLMLQVAKAYAGAGEKTKQKLDTLFINLLDHLDDQGWSYGSGMGALHHHGYNLEGFYPACLMMKDVIKKHGRLERTAKSMAWFSGLGRTLQLPDQLPSSNIDVLNTLLGSMLSSVLIMDNSPQKVCALYSFSKWLSNNIMPDHTIEGAFKPDGAVFHHGNLYPAYGIGGYNGVCPIVYELSGTKFSVSAAAHRSLRNSLLMMHYYTNPYKWPISVSGRHPTGDWKIAELPYAYMALAGSPDKRNKIDTLMASIYLRLNSKDEYAKKFLQMQIKPAGYTSGHWDLNYGLFDMHRRQNWLLTVRGHNRYFVSNESYPGANMYGRYLSYGQLEVLFPPDKSNNGSNFKDAGWDWNDIPGTTTIHYPLEKLRANIINADDFSGVEEMLISDEVFAGGTTFKKQGLFAMKIHGPDKYDMGSFRATKSWFMFDSLIVCLGSNVRDSIKAYPTQTTLFQNVLTDTSENIVLNGKNIRQFPYQFIGAANQPVCIMDNRKIGYYLPDGKDVVLVKTNQQSRDQTDSRETSGNFVKVTLKHGYAPVNAGYEYAMLIDSNAQHLNALKQSMESNKPLYKILRKDSIAHAVWYGPQRLTAMAVFRAGNRLSDSLIVQSSKPCLLMYQKVNDQITMSVTDPDLAFYSGPDDSPLTADGKRKEVSIYSRSWYKSPSKPSVIHLEIKGKWRSVAVQKQVQAHIQKDGNTMISVDCKDGLVTEVRLRR